MLKLPSEPAIFGKAGRSAGDRHMVRGRWDDRRRSSIANPAKLRALFLLAGRR